METGRRWQIITNCFVLAFLVFNAALLYHVWGQLKRIEVDLADAREAARTVKTLADDLDRAVQAMKLLDAPVKGMVQDVKQTVRQVKLDDLLKSVLKDVQLRVEKKEAPPAPAAAESEPRTEDGAAPAESKP